jgi:hypothetical protein
MPLPRRRRACPNAPDHRPPRANPARPPPDTNGAIAGHIDRAVDRLGLCGGGGSKSRRDGHRPDAREHVRRYLLREATGVSVRYLMHVTGLTRSTFYESLRQGKRLCRENAAGLDAAALGIFRPQVALDVEGDDSDDAY